VIVNEDFRTLYADPGEDFGWAIGRGTALLSRGIEKMWPTAHELWAALHNPLDPELMLNSPDFLRAEVDPELLKVPIGRIVCEDFRLYPWKLKDGSMDFDEVRTARVIGAMTFMAQLLHVPMILQGADIKPAAEAAGAEELYDRPLYENRHSNDAIQHFVFYTNVELMGVKLVVPKSVRPAD
jgi:hypothetical protein